MFPILYATAEIPTSGWLSVGFHKIIREDHNADLWPEVVSLTKYPTHYHRNKNIPNYETHKDALRALLASVTKNMTKLVDTDVTVL
jgi:hypothetical protein